MTDQELLDQFQAFLGEDWQNNFLLSLHPDLWDDATTLHSTLDYANLIIQKAICIKMAIEGKMVLGFDLKNHDLDFFEVEDLESEKARREVIKEVLTNGAENLL